MELSLDDIIKKKKISGGAAKKFIPKQSLPLRKTLNRAIIREAPPRIADARIKIIQNNRARIVDARDKLVEITRASGDARLRLQKQKQHSVGGGGERRGAGPYKNGKPHHHQDAAHNYRNGHGGGGGGRHLEPLRKVSAGGVVGLRTKGAQYRAAASRSGGLESRDSHHEIYRRQANVVDIPRGYVDYDNMARMEEEEYAAASHLSRTVTNDMVPPHHYDTYGPPLPPSARSERGMTPPAPRRLNSWGSTASEHFDPFDIYEVPLGAGRHERRMSPDLPPPPPKGILRPSSSGGSGARQHSPNPELYQRRYMGENASHLSYEMRSRLQHAPDPHASMGIFSNTLKTSSGSGSSSSSGTAAAAHPSSTSGHRIVVSNLHVSVTTSDIKELFEDLGALFDSRIVRPGVAEVIYKQLADAEKAVDTYHNRQLDGQPMKCMLVNARSSNKPTAPAIKAHTSSSSRLTSGKTPLEIDIDALHKVLFRRH